MAHTVLVIPVLLLMIPIFDTAFVTLTRLLAGRSPAVGGRDRDVLVGSAGNDTLSGGAGDDTYVVDSAGDAVTDTGGIDRVMASIPYELGADLEHLTLTGNGNIGGTEIEHDHAESA